jgi:hypothetical protein
MSQVEAPGASQGTVAFPIDGYEQLTVAQVTPKLAALTPPQLRFLREFERRHANRGAVLAAIEKALG